MVTGFMFGRHLFLRFLACLFLFLKTKKSLKKLEKDFKSEVEKLSTEQVDNLKTRKITKEILSSQSKIK